MQHDASEMTKVERKSSPVTSDLQKTKEAFDRGKNDHRTFARADPTVTHCDVALCLTLLVRVTQFLLILPQPVSGNTYKEKVGVNFSIHQSKNLYRGSKDDPQTTACKSHAN